MKNGFWKYFTIYATLAGIITSGTWWAASQDKDIKTLKDKDIPKVELKIDTHISDQKTYESDLIKALRSLSDTLIAMRYDQKSMQKDLSRINKKLKID
jgi:pyrimidine operon attenuation protein/uracil phosphoribosyltransferase